jgi:hypothetical protein
MKMAGESFEERINMKRLFKLGRKTTIMFEQLRQEYGGKVMSRPHVFEWCK